MNKIRGIATSGGVAFGPVRFVGAPSRQVVINKAENPAQEKKKKSAFMLSMARRAMLPVSSSQGERR